MGLCVVRCRRSYRGAPRAAPVALSSPGPATAVLQSVLEQLGPDLDACFRAAARAPAPALSVSAPVVLARSGVLGPDQTAAWDTWRATSPSSVLRALAERQLQAWGLVGEDVFVAVLVVSGLVTNAVRHASAPLTLRLIRQETLTYEVTDGSSTRPSPAVRAPERRGRARPAHRRPERVTVGGRHGPEGKTVWAEQELTQQ